MQLIVISGKGGTGKTTVVGSFAYLSQNSIKGDCDVDAANLHILFNGEEKSRESFIGAKVAYIDPMKCIQCNLCSQVCRFSAIEEFHVQELRCEGCGACISQCQQKAISLRDEVTGETILTQTNSGLLSRAEMGIGAEGSGKLVTKVRKNALENRREDEWIILDGSPGVGCAVMASITGCDAALIVAEPTQSGFQDFLRVLEIVIYFGVKPFVCINKYDINERITYEIEEFCKEKKVKTIGKIPFDPMVKRAINEGKAVVAYEESAAGKEIKKIWNELENSIREEF